MAAWLVPALKAVLPHIGTIISAAAPVFTRRTDAASDSTALLQRQIGELQAAAAQNATHVKDLAAQLRTALAALEDAATKAEAELQRAHRLSVIALLLSLLSAAVALLALLT